MEEIPPKQRHAFPTATLVCRLISAVRAFVVSSPASAAASSSRDGNRDLSYFRCFEAEKQAPM
jgi:hypothetical protein